MAEPLPATFSLSLPARLCANPSSTTGVFPHGGINLGDINEMAFVAGPKIEEIPDESLSDEVTENVAMSESCQLQLEMSGLSVGLSSLLFATPTAGGGGAYRAGDDSRLLSASAVVLYVSPVFPATQAGILIYRASAHWGDTARFRMRAGTPAGTLITFRGIRSAARGCYQIDLPAALLL